MLRLYGLPEMWNYFGADRPFSAWTYYVSAPVPGNQPVGLAGVWCAAALSDRAGDGMEPFPAVAKTGSANLTVAAALFVVYPIFHAAGDRGFLPPALDGLPVVFPVGGLHAGGGPAARTKPGCFT